MTLFLRAYDHGRQESFRAIVARFAKLLSSIRALCPEIEGWRGLLGEAPFPIEGEPDAEAVVATSARMWRSGNEELVAYGPSAVGLHLGLEVVNVSLVAGVGASTLPVWVPNQSNIEIRPPLSTELMKNRERLQALLMGLVSACQPAWAVVEVDGHPTPPVPPFADGAPSVGWMTFLDRAYGAVPRALPEPSVAVDTGLGTLIVAHSSRPDRDAISRVQLALGDAVLRPARALGTSALAR